MNNSSSFNISNYAPTPPLQEPLATPIKFELGLSIILYGTISYIVIFLIGVFGNLMVIYVLLKEKELRNFTNYLLANLSIADLMVLFACVPAGLHDLFAKERWYLGKIMCYSIAFIENCMGFASISSIFFITCDRYYVICRPLSVKSTMTQSRTLKLILLIWLVSIIINLPFVFLTEYDLRYFSDNQQMEYRCDAKSRGEWSFYYIIGNTFIFYLIIGLILLLMYHRITKKLNNSNKFLVLSSINKHDDNNESFAYHQCNSNSKSLKFNQINRANHSVTFSSITEQQQLTNNPQMTNKNLEKFIKQRQKLIFMLMCIIVVFYVCLFPLKIWNLIIMVGSKVVKYGFFKNLQYKHYWLINITTRIFFYINSSINPILYNFLSKKFRRSFGRIFPFSICFSSFDRKKQTASTSLGKVNNNTINEKYNNVKQKNLDRSMKKPSNFSFLANITNVDGSIKAINKREFKKSISINIPNDQNDRKLIDTTLDEPNNE